MALHRAGRLEDAAGGYEGVLELDPDNFDALHFLGVVALQTGDAQRAIEWLLRARNVEPNAFPAIHQLGVAYLAVGRLDDAAREFAQAAELAPNYTPTHESLANLRHRQGRLHDAATEFTIVARLQPDSAAAQNNLGTVLGQLGQYDEALACFERSLAIDPQNTIALSNSAAVLVKLGRPSEAILPFRLLIAQSPTDANACYTAGFLFYEQGLRVEAQDAFAMALARDPQYVEARWAHAIAELPLAYGPDEDPAAYRERFADAVNRLDQWFDASRAPAGHRAVGNQQPFYLAFHEVDNRPLLSRFGDLCARLMQLEYPDAVRPSRRAGPAAHVRVAIASAYFHDQSVWTALVRGWCAHLDPRRVEVHLLHTGTVDDAQTAIARAQAASFQMGLGGVSQWVDALRKLDPDVLLYPEIGMDTMCTKLASLRLAPVQAVSWGHPETTGLPSIDYFLSAELFEPPGGAGHYRERLIALPNLGCYYEPLAPEDTNSRWDALEIDEDSPRLICAGSPYKYFPAHDLVLVEIARRLGRCQFLFFDDRAPHLSRQVEARLMRAFGRHGLDAARFVRFLPRQARPDFFALMRRSDVYLDTIGFSGFNTAIQAVECGLPVVTWEGRFMRGRLGAGVMRRLGLDELVVHDAKTYVDMAARLCSDPDYRRDVGRRMASHSPILYRDPVPVRALEDFLVGAVSRS
jgi:protein O-GlcNAc transferase